MFLATDVLSPLITLQGAFTDQHFDQDLNFHASEEDPVTKKVIIIPFPASGNLSHSLVCVVLSKNSYWKFDDMYDYKIT